MMTLNICQTAFDLSIRQWQMSSMIVLPKQPVKFFNILDLQDEFVEPDPSE